MIDLQKVHFWPFLRTTWAITQDSTKHFKRAGSVMLNTVTPTTTKIVNWKSLKPCSPKTETKIGLRGIKFVPVTVYTYVSDLKCFSASEILICKSDNWVAIQSTLWWWSPLCNSHNVLSRPPAVYGLCYLMATASILLAINCGNLCTMVTLPWYNFFCHTSSLPTPLIRWLQWRNCHDQTG